MTIIEYIGSNPQSKFSDIQAATGLGKSECSRMLAELKRNGAIIMTGVKRGARYTVAQCDFRIEVDGDRMALVDAVST